KDDWILLSVCEHPVSGTRFGVSNRFRGARPLSAERAEKQTARGAAPAGRRDFAPFAGKPTHFFFGVSFASASSFRITTIVARCLLGSPATGAFLSLSTSASLALAGVTVLLFCGLAAAMFSLTVCPTVRFSKSA